MAIVHNMKSGYLEIFNGLITDYQADAIVCPLETNLEFCTASGNAFPAINEWDGERIFGEARKIANNYASEHGMQKYGNILTKVPVHSAHISGAVRLPFTKYIIHSAAVDYTLSGSMYYNHDVIEKSAKNVFELGKEKKLKSIGFPTFPTIGTKARNEVTLEDSLEAISNAAINHMEGETSIERVGIVMGDRSYDEAKWFLTNKFARML